MIQFRDFSFRFREGADLVVRDINLTIPDGCFVGITGAAGSGVKVISQSIASGTEVAAGSVVTVQMGQMTNIDERAGSIG